MVSNLLPGSSSPRTHALFFTLLLLLATFAVQESSDPYLWLEEVEGEKALAWVKERNQTTKDAYEERPEFKAIYDRSLAILDSKEKLLYPRVLGGSVYNFWRDAEHERGVLRRLPLKRFLSGKKNWETVLDVDVLSEEEDENWVFAGHMPLGPDYRRTLVWLSRGGSDACVVREFDLASKTFVEDGFVLPEAKSRLAWRDANSLYVGTDFGDDSMTDSGYPRILKVWERGTPLSEARTLLEVNKEDISVSAQVYRRPEGQVDLVTRMIDFWTKETFLLDQGELKKLPLPDDADVGPVFQGKLMVTLHSDWEIQGVSYPAGCVLSFDLAKLVDGKAKSQVLHKPTKGDYVNGLYALADGLVVTISKDVKTELHLYRYRRGTWKSKKIKKAAGATAAVAAYESSRNDFFFTYQDWLSPTTLNYFKDGRVKKVQSLPATFSSRGLVSEQHWATSADGTRIPYYVVRAKNLRYDGSAPTLLYGYGGFRVSLLPTYLALAGPSWLERGGVYVSANIRGGGEFGPAWHQAALRENRPRAFEDFEAVGEDLIDKGITSPEHLGIKGGSNGGLLVGAALTRRPGLYSAAIIGVPLLDMKRYHKLLAGASWMAEYGDPDKAEDWAFLKTYSPYHNIAKNKDYPTPLIFTSTKDDRVHPGHARKMTARMTELGHEVVYYENLEGGHGAASNNAQAAYFTALSYSYLLERLK